MLVVRRSQLVAERAPAAAPIDGPNQIKPLRSESAPAIRSAKQSCVASNDRVTHYLKREFCSRRLGLIVLNGLAEGAVAAVRIVGNNNVHRSGGARAHNAGNDNHRPTPPN